MIIVMMIYWPFLLIYLIRLTELRNLCTNNVPFVFNGHYIVWPTKKVERTFITNKDYVPKNIIYTKFQISSNRVFLVAPRYKCGVPFTLGYTVFTNTNKCYTHVTPIPCIVKQDAKLGKCDDGVLINAVDLVFGQDGVLWVLDIGITQTLKIKSIDGDPKVVGYDANTGHIKHKISLMALTIQNKSRLYSLVVEYREDEKQTILYVADSGTRSIIVWRVECNEGYRVRLPNSVAGCTENPDNMILYIALVENQDCTYIYFTYVYNKSLYRVKTQDLQRHMDPKFIANVGTKPCKMAFIGVGYGTVLYFRIVGQNNMYSWDTKCQFVKQNFMVVLKTKDSRMITHMDIDNEGVLWVMDSDIQDFMKDRVGLLGPNIILMPVTEDPAPICMEICKS